MAPGATEVKVPPAATTIAHLLAATERSQQSLSLKITSTEAASVRGEREPVRLEKLLRRRRQLELEIARKEKFLRRLEEDERDHL